MKGMWSGLARKIIQLDMTKKLEDAVKKQADSLDPAQREFVLAEFETYKWNAKRQRDLEKQLEAGIVDAEGFHNYDAEGKLFRQRHQIVTEQSSLFSHIMRWLKGTASEQSELAAFLEE